MMKNIGILVPVLLAFLLNVEAVDFTNCDTLHSAEAIRQCQAAMCGFGDDPNDCAPFDFIYYGAVASRTAISLMVFIILLIIVVIIEKV